MYSPNQAENISEMGYRLDQRVPDAKVAEKGITVYRAFNMFPLDQAERKKYELKACFASEEKFFNSPENTEFEQGFSRCDLEHLSRMWGAAHPPAPSSAVAEGFGPGQTREYIEQKHLAKSV
jgi:hypothetical protein